jgi:hypothetical protein
VRRRAGLSLLRTQSPVGHRVCHLSGMPIFYFDVREGTRFVTDDDGVECRDLCAAERLAAEAAAEISRDVLPRSDIRDVTIELRNEHKQRVLTVTVTMLVERVNPEPEPPSLT